MKFPTIHLNGTSKESLLEALEQAYLAISVAEGKLAETAPNGRDYYVQEPGAFYVAQDEHCARMQKLADVKREIEQLCEGITFNSSPARP